MNAILYSTFDGNDATRYGHSMEPVLEDWLKNEYCGDLEVAHVGLVAHKARKYLAGSPDGIGINRRKDERFLIEYKAPHSLHMNKVSVQSAVEDRSFFLYVVDGVIKLKRSHDYFYQIQGLLEILDLEYCMLVVGGHESRCKVLVNRDRQFFISICDKLEKFYKGALLPERCYPMKRRGGLRKVVLDINLI